MTQPEPAGPADALLLFTRASDLVPLAGQPERPLTETARLHRLGRVVTLSMPTVGALSDVYAQTVGDNEGDAQAAWEAERDALLASGWTAREPEPWEIHDPLRSDAKASF